MADDVSSYLSSKIGEYRVLAAPLERAAREMEYTHTLLRSKLEDEITQEVPALGALAEILDISILDMLMSPDRYRFVAEAMTRAGLSSQDVLQQLRSLGPPPRREELEALGLPS
jgi:hypothetical protein